MSKLDQVYQNVSQEKNNLVQTKVNLTHELQSLGMVIIPFASSQGHWSSLLEQKIVQGFKSLVHKTETGNGEQLIFWQDAEGFVIDYYYDVLTAAKDFAYNLLQTFPGVKLEAKQIKIAGKKNCLRLYVAFNKLERN